MKQPERARLIPVYGEDNKPDLKNAVDVQFNPTSLRVGLSNSLKTGDQPTSGKAAQYVSGSSSNLSVELIFDTTLPDGYVGEQSSQDVRLLTRKIPEQFLKPGDMVDNDRETKLPPSRCLFQWGAFEFVGLLEKFDETLDFFSPEGTPLRATVSLAFKENEYQFLNRKADSTERAMPSISSTGSNKQTGSQENTHPVAGASDNSKGNWRDIALYNGVENPRLPPASEIATPSLSPAKELGMIKGQASSAVTGAMNSAAPAFRYGNSSSLGSSIEGAFGHSLGNSFQDGLSAESLRATRDQGIKDLRNKTDKPWMKGARRAAQDYGVGFD